jgi:hypothetical protein
MDKEVLERISQAEGWTNRQKIDKLLEIDSFTRANLGIDSTKKDVEEAKRLTARIIREIKKIDPEEGKLFTIYND